MDVGYGLITCQRPPDDPRSDADLYREAVERCVLAEQLISEGRLILGLGAGWREEEFELFGVGLDERAARMRETLAILRGAFADDTFTHAGRHYSFVRGTIICGTPDEVVAEIGRFREALGDDVHFICRSDFPGLPSEAQTRLIRILGEKALLAMKG